MPEKIRVVIVGGGYAGLKVVENLWRCDAVEIILIDQNSYHYLQTDVYDYIANKTNLSDIAVDLYTWAASYLGRVTFLQEEVIRIDFANKNLTTSHSRQRYDYLVIATGSRTLLPDSIEGLSHFFHGVKSLPNALRFKQRFEECMFKKIETEGRCSLDSNFNIVVGGGGLSGVEIAAEMAAYSKRFFQSKGYLCGGVRVILICSSDSLLKGNNLFLQQQARLRLEALGVEIIWGRRVMHVLAEEAQLDDGSTIRMNFLIWTGGITTPTLIKNLTVEKNKKGQIRVDPFFRLLDFQDVFCIGDSAEMFDPVAGNMLPPTAQAAEMSGKYVAKNILRLAYGKLPEKEAIAMKGMLTALGGGFGAGVLFDTFRFKGRWAFYIKKMVEKSYLLPLMLRCRRGYKIMMDEG
jgi:NADH dehydrogenase